MNINDFTERKERELARNAVRSELEEAVVAAIANTYEAELEVKGNVYPLEMGPHNSELEVVVRDYDEEEEGEGPIYETANKARGLDQSMRMRTYLTTLREDYLNIVRLSTSIARESESLEEQLKELPEVEYFGREGEHKPPT